MATYAKKALSGAANGKQVKVAATATPGTLIHTAVSGEIDWDEIWIYAYNHDTAPRTLSIEWGGTTSPDDLETVVIPPKSGLVLVVPGLILQNGLVARAFASAANVIMISGWVNRITA